jgi:carboxyl-terminal processing protease
MQGDTVHYRTGIAAAAIIAALLYVYPVHAAENNTLNILDKLDIQTQIAGYVQSEYVDSLSVLDLYDGAIEGMIGRLDPHSSYMPPETYDDFSERIRGNFQGIGITFALIDSMVTVIDVIEGGPSEKAGLKSGDRIIKIDGKPAVGLTSDGVKERLRGQAGSKVTVQVERRLHDTRNEGTRHLDIPITRAAVEMNSVSHAYMIDQETGYIGLTSFTLNTVADVQRALSKLRQQNMKRLVFDLRGNSGGSLDAAIGVVDIFIKDGVIVSTKGKTKRQTRSWQASGEGNFGNLPIIVMINHSSASASEIVAGALQDHDRALIVGQTSFGKGLVMNPIPLTTKNTQKNLGTLMLTIARYYTPSGRLIQRPYTGDREEYISEGLDDYDPNAATEDLSARPLFKTDLGRKVYGGGGITPDKTLAASGRLNQFEAALRATNLVFQFTCDYLLRNPSIGNDFNSLMANFSLSSEEINRFRTFVVANGIVIDNKTPFREELRQLLQKYDIAADQESSIEKILNANGVDINDTLFEKSRDFVEREIKMEIARIIWGSEYRYRVWHRDDTELIGALSYFSDAQDLLTRRLAIGKLKP